MSQSPSEERLDDNYVNGWKALTESILQGDSFSGYEKNCAFLNLGDEQFATVSAISGFNFDDDARGMALSDWDGDGDVDIWLSNRNAPRVRYLENNDRSSNRFLKIKLTGTTSNRDAIGARIEVMTEVTGQRSRTIKTLRAGEGFLSQSSKVLHFGLGQAEKVKAIIVHWPSGQTTELEAVELDQFIHITEGQTGFDVYETDKQKTTHTTSTQAKPNPKNNSSQAHLRLTTEVPLPRLPWKTFDGQKQFTDRRFAKGKPWLLNLWASWCAPCHEEIQELIKHKKELETLGLNVLALSVDGLGTHPGQPKAAQRLLKKWRYPYASGVATPELIEALQIFQDELFDAKRPLPVPTSFLIDAAGNIAGLYRGAVSVERLTQDLQSLELKDSALLEYALPFKGQWLVPPVTGSFFPVGWGLVEKGNLEIAFRYVIENQAALKKDDEYGKLTYLLGNRMSARGFTEPAMQLYLESITAMPDYAEAYFALGLKLHETKRMPGAIKAYRQAIEKKPSLAKPYFMLALAIQELDTSAKTINEAKALLKMAIERDADYQAAKDALKALEE